jgi:uncharacterized protein (TIGR04255 family)
LQIQNSIFYYNWRKREATKSYPRYKSIIRPFKSNLDKFAAFLERHDLGPIAPKEFELSYINQLFFDQSWGDEYDLSKIFPDIKWRTTIKRFLPLPNQRTWTTTFSLPNGNGDLQVRLNHGVRKSDNAPLVQLELKAHGLSSGQPPYDIFKWYDLAHEWIVRGFADLTSKTAQEELWQRDDEFAR